MEVAAEEVMLLAAAEKGDLIKLRETIEDYSVPINAIESVSGRTALHYAVERCDLKMVDYLLAHKADPSIRDKNGEFPLGMVVKRSNMELLELFLTYKPAPDILASVFLVAAKEGLSGPLNLLLEKLHQKQIFFDINAKGEHDRRVLHLAAAAGHAAICAQLIREGVEANACDDERQTALFSACRFQRTDALQVLLDTPTVKIGHRNKFGHTVLHKAAADNHVSCIQTIYRKHGLKCNTLLSSEQQTPLFSAVKFGSLEAVKLLVLEYKCPINQKDYKGQTLMHVACSARGKRANTAVLQFLYVDCNASTEETDNDGLTPLLCAAIAGNLDAVQFLLQDIGVDVNHADAKAKFGHAAVVQELLEHNPLLTKTKSGHFPADLASGPAICSLLQRYQSECEEATQPKRKATELLLAPPSLPPVPQGAKSEPPLPDLVQPSVKRLRSEADSNQPKPRHRLSPTICASPPRDARPEVGEDSDSLPTLPLNELSPLQAPAQVIQSPPVRESNAYVNVGPHWNQSLDKPEMDLGIIIPYEELVFGNKLGSGAFGSVLKAVWNHMDVAVKILHKSGDANALRMFYKEAALLSKARHPNIVQYMGACVKPHLCIVMRYLPESLQSLLKKTGALPIPRLATIAHGIALGLIYLHRLKIIHRDLKPSNILLDEHDTPYIADFGVSREFIATSTMTGIGTPLYMAPEMFISHKYSEKVDVYAFAMILWQMLTGKSLSAGFGIEEDQEFNGIRIAFRAAAEQYRPPIPESCPAPLKSLIVGCWQHDPEKRPSFTDIADVLGTLK